MADHGGADARPIYCATIEQIVEHAPDVRSLFLRLGGGARLHFVPGQFISLSVPSPDGVRVKPYTVASDPDATGPLEIIFNRVPGGVASTYLFSRVEGDELSFTGPFGLFTLNEVPKRETIMIARGTAVAPFRPMLKRALITLHARVELIHASQQADQLTYRAEFATLQEKDPEFDYTPWLEPDEKESLTELVTRRFIAEDSWRDRRFFICGVGAEVLTLRDLLRANGYARRDVHYERW